MTNDKDDGNREREPTQTPGYVHVPQLREKLAWLYGWHPLVKTQYLLAREMGISPATLSSWLNGKRYTDTRTRAVVNSHTFPKNHFQRFLNMYTLQQSTIRT